MPPTMRPARTGSILGSKQQVRMPNRHVRQLVPLRSSLKDPADSTAQHSPQSSAPQPQQHVGYINGERYVFDDVIPPADPDLITDLKRAVRRTLSGRLVAMEDAVEEAVKRAAEAAAAQVEMPPPEQRNRHVGYINGVLHVFDDSIPQDPSLSRELSAARDALRDASRLTARPANQPPASTTASGPGAQSNDVVYTNGHPAGSPMAGPIHLVGQGRHYAIDSALMGNVVPLGPAGGPAGFAIAPARQSDVSPPPIAGAPGSSAFLTPSELYLKVAETGLSKATLPLSKVLLLGVLAGSYTAFGATLALSVGGQCPGLAAANPGLQKAIFGLYGLPFGAMMAVICGAELFTGNTGFWAAALFEKRVSGKQVMKAGLASYLGNALGAAFMVTLVSLSGIFMTASAGPIAIATAKVSLPWHQAFVRAILANWLLSLAMMMAAAATSVVGKAVATLVPISAFVTMGFEHSIANMFFVPLGIVLGAPVHPLQFLLRNLLPVTLGNIVGGTLCCALSYSLGFGTIGERAKDRMKAHSKHAK